MKKLARIEASSICRQQFANVFADCFCAVHTRQLEFANFSWPCEGRFSEFSYYQRRQWQQERHQHKVSREKQWLFTGVINFASSGEWKGRRIIFGISCLSMFLEPPSSPQSSLRPLKSNYYTYTYIHIYWLVPKKIDFPMSGTNLYDVFLLPCVKSEKLGHNYGESLEMGP